MISKSIVNSAPCDGVFVLTHFRTSKMDNKTIIRFGFFDILNNQDLGNCYQPRPLARLITLTSILIIPGITKTSSNNCYFFIIIASFQFHPYNYSSWQSLFYAFISYCGQGYVKTRSLVKYLRGARPSGPTPLHGP